MLHQDFKNRSSMFRLAIENFISENLEEPLSKKLVVSLPNNTVNKLLDCISGGDVINIPSAVQIALDRYLNSIDDYYLTKRKQVLESRAEYQKEFANRLSTEDTLKR